MAYGKGYREASKEFDEALRKIPQMGYGLILISHSQDKTFVDETGVEFNQIVPTLGKQPSLVVERMSDIMGFANPVQHEDGTTSTKLYMRGTPRFVAGSRFKYTPDSIDFTYENLVKAIGDAIDKQAEALNGKYVTDAPSNNYKTAEGPSFQELKDQFADIVTKVQQSTGENFATTWAPKIVAITERYLGKGRKVNDMTENQIEQLDLIVHDLIEEVGKGL